MMDLLSRKRKIMATVPKFPRPSKATTARQPAASEKKMTKFASKVEAFIEARRSKMTDTERTKADAKANALFDEIGAEK
jgi:hypothetical protein